MTQTGIHPRIPGYLGRALSLEFSAVQQYMTQASLLDAWGLPEAASRLRGEMVNRMHHADRITECMLSLRLAPAASQLYPVRVGANLPALIQEDLRLEREILALLQEAMMVCRRIGDARREGFFAALLEESQRGMSELQEWLRSMGHGQRQPGADRVYF